MAHWWRPHTWFWNIPLSLLVICFKVEPFYFQNAFYLEVREKGELCEKQTLSYSPSPGLKMTSWTPTTFDQRDWSQKPGHVILRTILYVIKVLKSGWKVKMHKQWVQRTSFKILRREAHSMKRCSRTKRGSYLLNSDIEDTWLCLQGKKVETVKRVRQNK